MKSLLLAGALTLVVGPAVVQSTVGNQSPPKGSWQAQPNGVTDEFHAIAFATDQVGVVTRAKWTVVRTTDGGKTWKRVTWAQGAGCAVLHDDVTASCITLSTTDDSVISQERVLGG